MGYFFAHALGLEFGVWCSEGLGNNFRGYQG